MMQSGKDTYDLNAGLNFLHYNFYFISQGINSFLKEQRLDF